MDYFSSIIYMIMNILSWKKIQVIFHACGSGTMDDDAIQLLDQALQKDNIRSISLRDSYELFTSLFCVRCPVIKTFDTALMCSRLYAGADTLNADHGICVVFRSECYEAQKSLVRHMMKKRLSFKLYTNGLPLDHITAKQILTELGVSPDHYHEYLLPSARNEEELIRQVTSFKHVFAYRMHSLIIASSFGVNHFGFVGDSKIPMFYRHLNAENRCSPLHTDSDFDAILNANRHPIPNLESLVKEQSDHSKACLLSCIANCTR